MELLIAVKSTGKLFDVATAATQVTYETNRTGSAGKLQFTVIKSGSLSFTEGDVVRFSVDGQLVFYGWVFEKSKNRWGEIAVTCYDRLRYLKASASYAFYDASAVDIIRRIAADFSLETSDIADTGYVFPSYIQQVKTCIDIIGEALEKTLLNTGKLFVFFDDGAGLSLRECGKWELPYVLGDGSLVTDYTYNTSIDKQTYNSVKIARPNEETGKTDIVQYEDSDAIGQWGLLRLYQSIDGSLNDAQMQSQAEASLKYYNRRTRTLTVESLGVVGLRAGMVIPMAIHGLGDMDLAQRVLVERVTHTWENNTHTMSFDTMNL